MRLERFSPFKYTVFHLKTGEDVVVLAMTREEFLRQKMGNQVLILDGAMGTAIQGLHLSEDDYSYEQRPPALGCSEILLFTRPDAIYDIHLEYLKAGADIISTDTFGANRFSLAEYGLDHLSYDFNLAAAELARAAVEEIEAQEETRYAFVAGSIGPTGKAASFSASAEDLTRRDASFDEFVEIFSEQARGLLDGNVDLFLIETAFDTLVVKAALTAVYTEMKKQSKELPVMVSVTFSDNSNRTLSGQTVEAFVSSMSHYPLFSLGLNCSTGIREMLPLIDRVAAVSPFPLSAHPNAGFPNLDGDYEQSASEFVSLMSQPLKQGLLHIVGGCCGTTPVHIRALRDSLSQYPVPSRVPKERGFTLSGLEPLEDPDSFIVVGERSNVAGSRKFARLIREHRYTQALSVLRSQIEMGSKVIDICLDDALIDSVSEMRTLLRHALSDPDIARIPFMIDSSDWPTIVTALKEIQGRAIVNSISLKDGEELFISKARFIDSMGSAMVVMLFDEHGQAATFEKKIEIAQRSYTLLTDQGIAPTSIVFDPNVLTIATGIAEHDSYGKDFIDAVAWITEHLPGVKVSGGVSNLSFSFRGNNFIREAMHAVFLDMARQKGLSMAIINPETQSDGSLLDQETYAIVRSAIEGVQTEALIEHAINVQDRELVRKEKSLDEQLPPAGRERLIWALKKGVDSYLEQDLSALCDLEAVDIIEGPLMDGMKAVGALFQEGRMFLPQVVRSARVMKMAVAILQPRLTEAKSAQGSTAGTVVFATVKGDVHDIGKNIVILVLECNNFHVIDLGVMVPAHQILDAARTHAADLVALSGLITPSLKEMEQVCSLFEQEGMDIPILIGGATTSERHTAIRIAPSYPARVFHGRDATQAVSSALTLLSSQAESFIETTDRHYREIREESRRSQLLLTPYSEAVRHRFHKQEPTLFRNLPYIQVIDWVRLEDLLPYVTYPNFFKAWLVSPESEEAQTLKRDLTALLEIPEVHEALNASIRGAYGLFPVTKDPQGRIRITAGEKETSFTFLRSQMPDRQGRFLSMSDFIHDSEIDTLGMFVLSAGLALGPLEQKYRDAGDDYSALLLATFSNRLAEAFSEYTEQRIVQPVWKVKTVRPGIGYPVTPDHTMKQQVFDLLEVTSSCGITLTESMAMKPLSTVSGFYFGGEDAGYFTLHGISEQQLEHYVQLTGRSRNEVLDMMPVDLYSESPKETL